MLSMHERWKIQDELDEKYMMAEMIVSGQLSEKDAEEIYMKNSPEKWPDFCAFLKEYRKDKEPISK